jgi:predicted RecB family endonuclease
MVKKKDNSSEDLVTKGYLTERLIEFKNELKTEIMREVRTLLHEALLESMENMKAYHQTETMRYITALIEEQREERKTLFDAIRGLTEKQDNHERRITTLKAA